MIREIKVFCYRKASAVSTYAVFMVIKAESKTSTSFSNVCGEGAKGAI